LVGDFVFYERSPSFLTEEAGVRERIAGFILLVEHRDHIAIFKSKLDLPAGFATRYLGRVPAERVDLAVARQDAIFEKIRLRNMSVSKFAMRNKTFEADDLRNVVGPAGASPSTGAAEVFIDTDAGWKALPSVKTAPSNLSLWSK